MIPDDQRFELSWGQWRLIVYGPVNLAVAILALTVGLVCYLGVA